MDLHANAVLTVRQRRRLVELVSAGVTVTAAALLVGCSRQTASKWVNRARRGEGLLDRSSRPRRSPRQTPAPLEGAILRARSELRAGPHVIGWAVGAAASTVHAVLRRHGRSRLLSPAARPEVIRYERERAGELVHVDCKRLGRILAPGHRVTGDRSPRGRGAGWLYLFCAIDDATGSASHASIPTRAPTRRSPSCANSSPSTPGTRSPSNACSLTTAPASSAAGPMAALGRGSRSGRPVPTVRRRTARWSTSSAPCSRPGRTPIPMRTSASGRLP